MQAGLKVEGLRVLIYQGTLISGQNIQLHYAIWFLGSLIYRLPNTSLSKSVTLADGSWRIFLSSSASIKKSPLRDRSVT